MNRPVDTCPNCGGEVPGHRVKCPHCGAESTWAGGVRYPLSGSPCAALEAEMARAEGTAVALECRRLEFRQAVPMRCLDMMDVEAIKDDARREAQLRFRAEIACQLLPTAKIDWQIDLPADWWQWFKARWFPAWAIKRWPVQTTNYGHKVELQRYVAYPDVVLLRQTAFLHVDVGRDSRTITPPSQWSAPK